MLQGSEIGGDADPEPCGKLDVCRLTLVPLEVCNRQFELRPTNVDDKRLSRWAPALSDAGSPAKSML